MERVILELDDETAARLEQFAPARSRKRSEFLRAAIRKAIWDLEEQRTAEAYARKPDGASDAFVSPQAWEPKQATKGSARRKKR